MRLRVVLVTILVVPLLFELYGESSAQTADEPTAAPPVIESPNPNPNVNPNPVPQPPQQDEHHPAEWTEQERNNAVFMLSELRGRVRTFPASAEDRLKLAQGLYLVGDLDAALGECRAALKLQPNNARALLQLGIILMAKQDGRAAATALVEAIRLDPELTHAHYSLLMLVEFGVLRHQIRGKISRVESDGIAVEFEISEPGYSELKALLAEHCFY